MSYQREKKVGGVDASRSGRGTWSAEEDQIIINSIEEGFLKWSDIGKRIPHERTGKQCRERWFNHLDPSLKRGPWTEEEDEALIEAQSRLGNSWTRIATEIEGRSENEVKNRWYSASIRNRRLSGTLSGAKRRLSEDGSETSPKAATPPLTKDELVSLRIAELHLPSMLRDYKRLQGSLSSVSSPHSAEPVHHVRFPAHPLQSTTQSAESAFLQSHTESVFNTANNSGLTTPLSFFGAFSSSGGSPTWFEGGASSTSSHSGDTSGTGGNSVSDALQLLLQGISVLPPDGSSMVPTAAAMLLGGGVNRGLTTEAESQKVSAGANQSARETAKPL